jgi:predicted TIM-barrel fold metal-dependent hydrolase
VLDAIDSAGALRSGGALGVFDVERRLQEMDREGVAAELLFQASQFAVGPFFAPSNDPYPPDVRAAGRKAYHRYVSDYIAPAGGRLLPVADPGPCLNIDESIVELRWAADHGFRAVTVPGLVTDSALPPLWDDHYEPFWRACVDTGMVLSVHAGHGQHQGLVSQYQARVLSLTDRDAFFETVVNGQDSPFAPTSVPAEVLWSLMIGGVFDRYPDLRLVLTEVRSDWVPATLRVLDARYERGDTPLAMPPSEYYRRNCWVAASSIKQSEVRRRHDIGIDKIMFGRDYPHPEGTWPNTLDWLRDAIGELPEEEIRLLLGENAIACYRLDRQMLARIAERVGPMIGDIRDNRGVDPRIVDHFAVRSGYRRSYEDIDVDSVAGAFERDLVAVRP